MFCKECRRGIPYAAFDYLLSFEKKQTFFIFILSFGNCFFSLLFTENMHKHFLPNQRFWELPKLTQGSQRPFGNPCCRVSAAPSFTLYFFTEKSIQKLT